MHAATTIGYPHSEYSIQTAQRTEIARMRAF